MTAGWALLSAVALFLGILLCLDVGFRWGRRRVSRDSEDAHEGIGAIEAAVFALLGLLLGFSFAGATSRLDTRRQLIVEEANAIGTAYLRLDLLPAAEQPVLRRLFREYLESRLRVYDKIGDQDAIDREFTLGAQIQMQIWQTGLIAASHETSREAVRLLVPALNEMIDVTTARAVALHTYLPPLILLLLLSVCTDERIVGWGCDGTTKESKRDAHDSLRGRGGSYRLRDSRSRSAEVGVDPAYSGGPRLGATKRVDSITPVTLGKGTK